MSEFEPSVSSKPFVTGRMVVLAMFAMGFLATGLLYAYWTLHLMPFMPLQEAIVAEFPGSAPRVEGGQKKGRKETPVILRIVMKSQIDPTATDPEAVQSMSDLHKRIVELVDAKVEFPGLNFIELHVYKLLQEKEIRERSWRFDLAARSGWTEIDEKGNSVPAPDSADVSSDASSSDADSPVTRPGESLR